MNRPNFLWICTDQQRFDTLGCYGNPIVKTPAVDRLAAEGVRFENYFVHAPQCVPSRVSMHTGRYPHTHRVPSNAYVLPDLVSAIAELDATVTWPAQDVEEARATFVDSAAYRRVESNLPLWPENLRRNLFITLFLTCLVSAGVLFIRGAALRIVALLVIASGGVLASAVQITREKTVFEQVIPAKPTMAASIESPPTNNADAGKLLMISCRRTTEWTGPAASVIPVYANLRDLSTDTTTIVWGRELHTLLHPDKVRLLRMRE